MLVFHYSHGFMLTSDHFLKFLKAYFYFKYTLQDVQLLGVGKVIYRFYQNAHHSKNF
jgi:hypothetical protein